MTIYKPTFFATKLLTALLMFIGSATPSWACISTQSDRVDRFVNQLEKYPANLLNTNGKTISLYGQKIDEFEYCSSKQFKSLSSGRRDLCHLSMMVTEITRELTFLILAEDIDESVVVSTTKEAENLILLLSRLDSGLKKRRAIESPTHYFYDQFKGSKVSLEKNTQLLKSLVEAALKRNSGTTNVESSSEQLKIIKAMAGTFLIWWTSLQADMPATKKSDDQRFNEQIINALNDHILLYADAVKACTKS